MLELQNNYQGGISGAHLIQSSVGPGSFLDVVSRKAPEMKLVQESESIFVFLNDGGRGVPLPSGASEHAATSTSATSDSDAPAAVAGAKAIVGSGSHRMVIGTLGSGYLPSVPGRT